MTNLTSSKYFGWERRTFLEDFLGTVTWMSLTTFVILAKNAIGTDRIPLFEVCMFLSGLAGIYIAHTKMTNVKLSVFMVNITESIFLIVLYYILLTTNNLEKAGYVVYGVIIAQAGLKKMRKEAKRDFEQNNFNKKSYNEGLRKIRKKTELLEMAGGAIGAGIAIITLTVMKMDIILFTEIMLILNIAQNIYGHYIWKRYLLK